MIQAFTVHQVVNLPTDRTRIGCAFAYADKLLLGMANGSLLVYTLDDPFSPQLSATLVATYDNICKRGIEKMGLIKDAGELFVLSDGLVYVLDMETFSLIEQLQHTRGASTFETIDGIVDLGDNYQAMCSRLAVGCKRKLVVYEWRDSEYICHKEILLSDRIRTLAFLNHDKVVCGLGSDYAVVDVQNESVVNTITPGSENAPSFTSVGISYMGIGSRQPVPLSVRLGEKEGDVLIVRDQACQFVSKDGQLVGNDIIELDSAPEQLAYSYPYLIMVQRGKIEIRNRETIGLLQEVDMEGVKLITNGKLMYAATDGNVVRLLAGDYSTQVQALANAGELEDAISLLNQIEPVLIKDKETKLRDLLMLQASKKFKNKEFDEAMQFFSDCSAPPAIVIGLYPKEISGDLATESDDTSVVAQEDDSMPEPISTSTSLTHGEFKHAVRKLQEYLSDTRRRIAKLLSGSSEKIEFHGFELSEKIYGDLNEAAVLVDTTLFRCYVHTSQALVGPLVRVANHCDPKVVQPQLERMGKWRELADFYYRKGMHREALELLQQLSKDEASLLDGPEPTVRYLQRLDAKHVDLIFEFAKWVLKEDPEYGRELFLEDSRECLSLPRQRVLKFLETLDDPSYYLPIIYLEYITGQMDDTSSTMHNNLGIMYTKSIQNGDQHDRFAAFMEFLKSDQKYRADRLLLEVPADDARFLEPRAILHGKRGDHRKALAIYAFDIGDAVLAREYCSEVYAKDAHQGQECLHTLLTLYLSHTEDTENNDAVLQLLARQGSRMSVIEVIRNLPADIHVADINSFLMSQIRSLNSANMNQQIDTALCKVNLVSTQEQLLELGQQHALVTNLKTCKVCNKRLGHSVISMFPDGVVVHYGCAKQYQQILNDEKANKPNSVKVNSLH